MNTSRLNNIKATLLIFFGSLFLLIGCSDQLVVDLENNQLGKSLKNFALFGDGDCPSLEIDGDDITIASEIQISIEDGHVEGQTECQIEENGMNFEFNQEFNGELAEEVIEQQGDCSNVKVEQQGDMYIITSTLKGSFDGEGLFEAQTECQKNGSGLNYESNIQTNLEVE